MASSVKASSSTLPPLRETSSNRAGNQSMVAAAGGQSLYCNCEAGSTRAGGARLVEGSSREPAATVGLSSSVR